MNLELADGLDADAMSLYPVELILGGCKVVLIIIHLLIPDDLSPALLTNGPDWHQLPGGSSGLARTATWPGVEKREVLIAGLHKKYHVSMWAALGPSVVT